MGEFNKVVGKYKIDLTSKFKAFNMLPVKLHIVIGKTHMAATWRSIPDIILSYSTIPIKFPTERYRGTNNMLINIEIFIALVMLYSMDEKSFLVIIELMVGIKTMLILPTIAIGTNNIGKVIPIITPKLETASLCV